FFLGLVAPVVFALALLRAWQLRRRVALHGVALLGSLASLASFFVGYTFSPAVSCFKLPHEHPSEYGLFFALLAVRPMGILELSGVRTPIALVFALAMLALGFWVFVRATR